jgi:hypothetical protein
MRSQSPDISRLDYTLLQDESFSREIKPEENISIDEVTSPVTYRKQHINALQQLQIDRDSAIQALMLAIQHQNKVLDKVSRIAAIKFGEGEKTIAALSKLVDGRIEMSSTAQIMDLTDDRSYKAMDEHPPNNEIDLQLAAAKLTLAKHKEAVDDARDLVQSTESRIRKTIRTICLLSAKVLGPELAHHAPTIDETQVDERGHILIPHFQV